MGTSLKKIVQTLLERRKRKKERGRKRDRERKRERERKLCCDNETNIERLLYIRSCFSYMYIVAGSMKGST